MPHVRDTDTEQAARRNFAAWLQGVIDDYKSRGVSKSALARQSGINRNDIDRWLKRETAPRPHNLRKFCDNLGLDYAEPARILGWNREVDPPQDPAELGEFIRRAKQIADDPRTSQERRVVLLARIEAAEQARRAAASSRLAAAQMEKAAEAQLKEIMESPGESVEG
jgi:transcriptional regulator with XRE-family HTH domain